MLLKPSVGSIDTLTREVSSGKGVAAAGTTLMERPGLTTLTGRPGLTTLMERPDSDEADGGGC